MFPSKNKSHTPQDIVQVEDSLGTVNNIMKAWKIRINAKDHGQYFVRLKNQKSDKDKLLAEDAIPDGDLHMRRFRASRRIEKSHQW
ncbi:hypothetical protein O181_003743 [Austropuccinia psidii MF-1]|uniref:Uncharacterized protein n=1 Tax=Austropuccinia psidii MF-1 TaxID=1389203 RepID=A0A9Q3BF04_9BASI|nr:hypothetical protein [Austropuccinia psidii MF-1]